MQTYKWFLHKSGESLGDIFSRFNRLLNDLKTYNKVFENKDVINKFMRALPPQWDSLVMVIMESVDLRSVTLEELYGTLQTHELCARQKLEMIEDTRKTRSVALMARRMSQGDEAPSHLMENRCGDDGESSSDEEETCSSTPKKEEEDKFSRDEIEAMDEDEFALFTKRFGKYRFNKNRSFKR